MCEEGGANALISISSITNTNLNYLMLFSSTLSHVVREKKKMCGERGSNTRPSDLQSDALPTELSPHKVAPDEN
ncbi:hypothetical protein CR513_49233, partial [Mucuna pruriens]